MNFSLLLVLQCDLLTHLEILCLLYLSLTLPTLVMDALTSCFSQECLVDTDGTLFSCRGAQTPTQRLLRNLDRTALLGYAQTASIVRICLNFSAFTFIFTIYPPRDRYLPALLILTADGWRKFTWHRGIKHWCTGVRIDRYSIHLRSITLT